MSASLGERSFAWLQYVLPKHLLSRWIHWITRSRVPWIKRLLIGGFLRGYDVNMSEAQPSDPQAYASFNEFFTRPLRPQVRAITDDPACIVSPVDGRVSKCGELTGDAILQAKGRTYSALELLGGREDWARRFTGGSFICLYLAPYNYHRMHMPLAGTLTDTVYIPGNLFSVNAATARAVPRLFARNERVVCGFDTQAGAMAFAMVGALFVGSIETVWAGEVNPPPRRRRAPVDMQGSKGLHLARGDEMGRFNMGSTVILLFEPGRVAWNADLKPDARVWLGQSLGTMNP